MTTQPTTTGSRPTTQTLMDNLNAGAQITSWCSAITNTDVAPSPGAWYQPFMTNLTTAKTHANQYLSTIGPNAWDLIPNAILHYGSTHNNAMGDVQRIMTAVGVGTLTSGQLTEIQEIFGALQGYLQKLLGDLHDSNLTTPSPQSIYGVYNDLETFRSNVTNDNKNLTTGQQGAAAEVGLLTTDEATMNNDITTLNSEISVWNQDIEDSEIGMGVSIFIAIIGVALAPVTGGGSLVLTAVGVVGLGGSIAADVVYSDKVKAALAQIAKDQSELTTDQQEVNALKGIIVAFTKLEGLNLLAQAAVENVVDSFHSLITDTTTVISDLEAADAPGAMGILENLNIQDAISDWTILVNLAQGIQDSSVTTQTLQPPA